METKAINFANNIYGTLSQKLINRIENYLANPNFENWEDIHCIILRADGKMPTIWNAVIEVDASFPMKGRQTDMEGNVTREWEKIPYPETVIKAIQNTCYNLNSN